MRTVLRAVLIAAAAILTVTLEVSVVPHLHLPYAVPDLVLLAVLAFAAEWGSAGGATAGFVVGFIQDIAPPSLDAIGRHALVLTIIGALAGRAARSVRRSALRTSILAGIYAALAMLLNALIGLLLGVGTGLSRPGVLLGLGAAALYTAVATPLVVPGLTALARRVAGPAARYLAPVGNAADGPVLPGPARAGSARSSSARPDSARAGSGLRPETERV